MQDENIRTIPVTEISDFKPLIYLAKSFGVNYTQILLVQIVGLIFSLSTNGPET
jgi:hypothetical protein